MIRSQQGIVFLAGALIGVLIGAALTFAISLDEDETTGRFCVTFSERGAQ